MMYFIDINLYTDNISPCLKRSYISPNMPYIIYHIISADSQDLHYTLSFVKIVNNRVDQSNICL